MSKKNRSIVIAVAILLVLAIAAFGIYRATRPAAVEGQKTITVSVTHADESKKDFPITTTVETLHQALDQEKLIQGEDRGGFFMVLVVDGETADYNVDGSYWAMLQDGEWMMTGVDDTMIQDGAHYEFVYTPAA